MSEPIPTPPGLPLVGNLFDLDAAEPIQSLAHLAQIYGPIYKLRMPTTELIVIANHELYDEICDERRFCKKIAPSLLQVRNGVGAGLFTAHQNEHDWEVAHRVLTPAFGPIAVRGMFDEMYDVSKQLAMKWARFGPDHPINVTEDFTRLTLDTIAVCAMDTRFNSFYSEEMHPFVDAMTEFLSESGRRANRPGLITSLMRSAEYQYQESIRVLQDTAKKIVAEKRANPSGKKDLIGAMLNGKDPKTGERMTDESIANNMITFLIAGHETTSGTLSFLLYRWLENPAIFQKARREVDAVVGDTPINVDHLSKLPYLTACLRETLRLNPTAPAHSVGVAPTNKENPVVIGGGRYRIEPSQTITNITVSIHLDPKVWGEDANVFKPERMLDEEFDKLPKNAWKPFGNGSRACIGRAFAWQEALLCAAVLLQNFDFRLHDPSYKLAIKQTLTIKPKDFLVHATPRSAVDPVALEQRLNRGAEKSGTTAPKLRRNTVSIPSRPMSIFFGGNMGTCESLAQKVANSAQLNGYNAEVKWLDDATESLPKDHPVLIITASYEGEPPDNATHFVEWLQSSKAADLEGVNYAVFGCGNRDWKTTFQRIPKLVDSCLEERGAKKIVERGFADAADNDIFNDFEKWEDGKFWPAVRKAFGGDKASSAGIATLDVDVSTTLRSSHLRQDVREAVVLSNKLLTANDTALKRHMELKLPTDMTYRAGDYLAVLPVNPSSVVLRVFKRFGVPWDAKLTIKGGQTFLPVGVPVSLHEILAEYVELNQPATRRNMNQIKVTIADESKRSELDLSEEDFTRQITEKRISVLDLLEKYPSAKVSIGEFLAMLPQLRLRQYSISSSPLADPSKVSVSWGVLNEESFQGDGRRFLGVASNYLSNLEAGDHVHINVKESHRSFHLPLDPTDTPILMVAAGTGIAPFRGFIQERAKQIEAGRKLAPAILFFGCRYPDKDCLFKDELAAWQKLGAVDVRYAFSRDPASSNGAKYVQDRIWNDRADVVEAFTAGAKVFVCGHGRVAEALKEVSKKIHVQAQKERYAKDVGEKEAEEWFVALRNERYMSDVFD